MKCRKVDEVECKSDEEVKRYFGTRAMYILSNQIRFDFEKYGEEAIIRETSVMS